MSNFNRVMLMGNLTRDVELKSIAGGSSVARISMAINRNWTTPNGEKKEEVTYVDCEAWGKTAEVMAKYLTKGRPVFIEGRLKLDMWEDKEGKKQSKLKVVVDGFQFIGGRDGAPGGGGGGGGDMEGSEYKPAARSSAGAGGGGGGRARPQPQPIDESSIGADDIPF